MPVFSCFPSKLHREFQDTSSGVSVSVFRGKVGESASRYMQKLKLMNSCMNRIHA